MATITIIDNLESIAEIAADAVSEMRADEIEFPMTEATMRNIVEMAVRRHLLSPEDLAMLQALYSRSPALVEEHLRKVKETGAGKFMSQYLVGYGHASIGDCGNTAIFIEGVSMLAAKAIQDWPLYSGQEASTRYMDFSRVTFGNPLGTAEGEKIQQRWREFYLANLPAVREHIAQTHPATADDDPKVYERAVNARAFDVMRGFLPAGAHTQLSWSTNLRQANDKLGWMVAHPDSEVRALGVQLFDALRKRYPHSFGQQSLKTARDGGRADAVASYVAGAMKHRYFLTHLPGVAASTGSVLVDTRLRGVRHADVRDLLAGRPKGAELPHWIGDCGTVTSEFWLDFGSFRDLQRHRAGVMRMPLLTVSRGFHRWYAEQLPWEVAVQAGRLTEQQLTALGSLPSETIEERATTQHYIAMGYRVPCRVVQPLPAFVYRMELRTSQTVHPTLRDTTLREARAFREDYPWIALHIDESEDTWSTRRGRQTIEEKRS